MKIGAKLLKLLSFKDLLSNTFSISFIRQYTQLVPSIFKAACVSYMETVGVFDLHAGHVRYGLKLQFLHDIIVYIFINHLAFFRAFLLSGSGGFPCVKIGNFLSNGIRQNTEPG